MASKFEFGFAELYDAGMILADRPRLSDEEKMALLTEMWPNAPEWFYRMAREMGDNADILKARKDEVVRRRKVFRVVPKQPDEE